MNTSLRLSWALPFILLAVSLGFAVALMGNETLAFAQRLYFVALMAILALFTGAVTPGTMVVIPSRLTWYVTLVLIAVWPVLTWGLTPVGQALSWFGFDSHLYIVAALLPLFIALAQPKDYDAWHHRFDDTVYG